MKKLTLTLSILSLGMLISPTVMGQNHVHQQNNNSTHDFEILTQQKPMTTQVRLTSLSRWDLVDQSSQIHEIDSTRFYWTGNIGDPNSGLKKLKELGVVAYSEKYYLNYPSLPTPLSNCDSFKSVRFSYFKNMDSIDNLIKVNERTNVLNSKNQVQRSHFIEYYPDGTVSSRNNDGYEYSSDGNISVVSELYLDTASNNWLPYKRKTYTTDNNGNITKISEEENSTNGLKNSRQYLRTYDAQGQMTKYESNTWNEGTNSWSYGNYDVIDFYNYDGSALKNRAIISYISSMTMHDTTTKIHYRFDLNGKLAGTIHTKRNFQFNKWDTTDSYVYNYDASGNLLTYTKQFYDPQYPFNSAPWANDWQNVYTYNNGLLTKITTNNYNHPSQRWEKQGDRITTYNSYNQPETHKIGSRVYYFRYEEFEYNENGGGAGIEKSIAETEFTLYPNPAKTEINVRMNDASVDGITVYDMTGKQVYIKYNNLKQQQMTIPVSHLASGVYVMRIQSGNKTGTKQFVVRY